MAHWFGLKPADLDELPPEELDEFVKALSSCPPVGAVFLVERKE